MPSRFSEWLRRFLSSAERSDNRGTKPKRSLSARLQLEPLEGRLVLTAAMPTDTTDPTVGQWHYEYFGPDASPPYNDPGVRDFGNYLFRLWSSGKPLPAYIAQVNFRDVVQFWANVPLDENGNPLSGLADTTNQLFLAQYQQFQGQVASFSAPTATANSLSAVIFWGDGTSSAGTIVDNGGGNFAVTGDHAWQLDGTYLVAVLVNQTSTDTSGQTTNSLIAAQGAPAFVFALKDPTTPEVLGLSATGIAGSTNLTQALTVGADGTFQMQLSGAAQYQLHYDTTERYGSKHRDATGTVTFGSLQATGYFNSSSPTDSSLSAETVDFGGSVSTQYSFSYADLLTQYSRTGTDSYTLTDSLRQADFTNGSYTVTETGQHTNSWTDTGFSTAGGDRQQPGAGPGTPSDVRDLYGNFTKTASQTDSYSRTETGAPAASYLRTDQHTLSASWQQTGTDFGVSYTLTAANEQATDQFDLNGAYYGPLWVSENYQLVGPGGVSPIVFRALDAGRNTTLTVTENDSDSLSRHYTWVQGAHYFDLQQNDSPGYSETQVGQADGFAINRTVSHSSSDFTEISGDDSAGTYSLSGYSFPTVTESTSDVDQALSVSVVGTATPQTYSSGTGNLLTGDYTVTDTAFGSQSTTQINSDQSESASETVTDAPTSTTTTIANSFTGAYTTTVISTTAPTTTGSGINQLASVSVTSNGTSSAVGTVTTISQGNLFAGDYTVTVTGTVTSTSTSGGADQSASGSGTVTPTETVSSLSSGNSFTGDYTATEYSRPTSGGTLTGVNSLPSVSPTGSGSDAAAGTLTTITRGNSFSGDYTATVTGTVTTTSTSTNADQTESGTDTVTATDTVSSTSSGNSFTGDYTATAYSTPNSTGTAAGVNALPSVSAAGGDTGMLSGTITTITRGNSFSGDYTATVTGTVTTTSTSNSSDQTESGTDTVTATDTVSSTSSGNSFTGDYTTTAVGNSTSTGSLFGLDALASVSVTSTGNGSITFTTTTITRGNSFSGDYTTTITSNGGSTGTAVEQDGPSNDTATLTDSSSATTIEAGNSFTGGYSLSSYSRSDSSGPISGVDDRGTFSGTSSDHVTATTNGTGNHISGDFTVTTTTTSTPSPQKSGGDVGYSQSISGFDQSTTTQTGNSISGSVSSTATASGSRTLVETGSSSGTNYTITETSASTSTNSGQSNSITRDYTTTVNASTRSTLSETATESGGNYTLTKQSYSANTDVRTGNDLTGSYSLTGNDSNSSTAIETATHTSGANETFTEILGESYLAGGSGNTIQGDYTVTTSTGNRTSSLVDDGTAAGGASFHVTEGSAGTFRHSDGGNSVVGNYTVTDTSTPSYTFQETLGGTTPFTLNETGTLTTTVTETGNRLTGGYNQTQTAADGYTLTETGTNTGGGFDETVTGAESVTQTENGNNANGVFSRTVTGGGGYSRTDSGAGATLTSGTGNTNYTLQEQADSRAGHFSVSTTGTDRYGLLERFNDVSNTRSAQQPGNMHYRPFGLPFTDADPPPADPNEDVEDVGDVGAAGPDLTGSKQSYDRLPSFLRAIDKTLTQGNDPQKMVFLKKLKEKMTAAGVDLKLDYESSWNWKTYEWNGNTLELKPKMTPEEAARAYYRAAVERFGDSLTNYESYVKGIRNDKWWDDALLAVKTGLRVDQAIAAFGALGAGIGLARGMRGFGRGIGSLEEGVRGARSLEAGAAARTAAPGKAPWKPPKGWNGPGEEKGQWAGDRGNSGWLDNRAEVQRITKGDPIPFVEGKVDFGKWVKAEFKVPGVKGGRANRNDDTKLIYKAIFEREGLGAPGEAFSWRKHQKIVTQWLERQPDGFGGTGLRPHHAGGENIQYVPKNLHKVQHTDVEAFIPPE